MTFPQVKQRTGMIIFFSALDGALRPQLYSADSRTFWLLIYTYYYYLQNYNFHPYLFYLNDSLSLFIF